MKGERNSEWNILRGSVCNLSKNYMDVIFSLLGLYNGTSPCGCGQRCESFGVYAASVFRVEVGWVVECSCVYRFWFS
jgi:hypothetical protein